MAKSSQSSSVGPALVITSALVLLGGAAAYVYYTREQIVLVDNDVLEDEPTSSGGVKTIKTTTTTTTTAEGETVEVVITEEDIQRAQAQDPESTREEKQERENVEAGKKDPAARREQEAQGIKVGEKIEFKKGDSEAVLLNYKLSGQSGANYKNTDSFPKNPLNQLYFSQDTIPQIVPRLGLATDLQQVSGEYPPLALSGMWTGTPEQQNRKFNRQMIAVCLGGPVAASSKEYNKLLGRIPNVTKERLACVVYDVVKAVNTYWDLRKASIANKYQEYSIYVFKNDAPSKEKKGRGGIADAEEKLSKLFDTGSNLLEKQRLAAAVLWTIVQASDDKNVGKLQNDLPERGFTDKNKPNMDSFSSRLGEGMKEAISHIATIKLPATENVMCANRYYRALVDAFFDGCFNCETRGVRALYVDRPKNKAQFRDFHLMEQGNLQILSGLVLHANKYPGTNRSMIEL